MPGDFLVARNPDAASSLPHLAVDVAHPSTAEVRAWALREGYVVGDRGRISSRLRAAYREAFPG